MIAWHDTAPFHRGRQSGTATPGQRGLQMRNADDSRTCDLVDLLDGIDCDAPEWTYSMGLLTCWGDTQPLSLVQQWAQADALAGVL